MFEIFSIFIENFKNFVSIKIFETFSKISISIKNFNIYKKFSTIFISKQRITANFCFLKEISNAFSKISVSVDNYKNFRFRKSTWFSIISSFIKKCLIFHFRGKFSTSVSFPPIESSKVFNKTLSFLRNIQKKRLYFIVELLELL